MEPRLNTAQKEAIHYTDGPLLIIAGAGTGKTTVVTQKIAHLVESGLAKPEEILALTFTEKAAEEMEARVDQLLSMGYTSMKIGTFHAFGQELLQQYGLDIGLPNQFTLLTQTDAWLRMKEAIYDFDLEYYRPISNPNRHIHELINHFSKCKDELISPAEYAQYTQQLPEDDEEQQQEKKRVLEVARAYASYNALLLEQAALDFGDLLFYSVSLLEQRPNILAGLQKRFKYILVDEFQDVNWAQYKLVQLLSENSQLTVVGDDDQSIYAFRGASVSNILRFKEDYPKAKEVVLTENYRSGQEILDTAYRSIQHNNPDRLEVKLQIDKKLKAKGTVKEGKVVHVHGATLYDEVQLVIDEIKRLKKETNATWDDFALLVRANNHADPYVKALQSAGIPYEFLASSGLYRQKIVMDALSFLRAVDSVKNSLVIFHLFRLPVLAFSENDIQKITGYAKKKSVSYYEALKRAQSIGCSDGGVEEAKKLLDYIHNGAKAARNNKPTTVLYEFLEESGYLAYLTKAEEEGDREIIRAIHHLRQLFELLEAYEIAVPDAHVHSFLEYYNNIQEAGDAGALYQPTDTPDSVNILTVHASKGLEFRYVFVVNLVEDRFPTRRRRDPIPLPEELLHETAPEGDAHEQEERRLLYVAMTRAKEHLYLCSGKEYGGVRSKKISRFLAEIGIGGEGVQQSQRLSVPMREESQEQDEVLAYRVPSAFSFSQIKAYQTCPYQYKLAHILKIPAQGKASFSFGQSMHLTLQHFYAKIQEMNSAQQGNLFDSPSAVEKTEGVRVPTLTELLALYEHAWISDWYKSASQRESYYKKGKEILTLFYKSHEGKWRVPVALESWFKIKVGGATLRGRIDRVDQKEDGTLEIIDYKTGKTKERLTAEDKEQLLIYQIAAQTLPEYRHIGETSSLTFYYLNDNVEISFLGKEKELEKLKTKLENTIEQIQSQDFTATPGVHVCRYCDFKEICQFRAG